MSDDQEIINLCLFAEIERGVEVADIDREPLVGSKVVLDRLSQQVADRHEMYIVENADAFPTLAGELTVGDVHER